MKYIPIRFRANLLLDGIIGKDPELNTFGDTKIANFSVAHTRSSKKNGEYVDVTSWYNCKAFNYVAEKVMNQLKKGMKISLSGELTMETFTNSQGIVKTNATVTVQEFILFDRIEISDDVQSNDNVTVNDNYDAPF